mmetsp:Transcript_50102/g.92462  ORF Transcript_50102/g.92462 Transcript_50102/m.92462 type:complete len:255 (+) Transcript_50102:470-1234(+)
MQASNWFNVDSASWLFPNRLMKSPVLLACKASTSSMKIMQGANLLARSKSCLTLDGPLPTKTSINSVPTADKNGTPASAAHALAKSVFPDPGGPTRRTPRGTRAPRAPYSSGLCSICTTSATSSLAASTPAMSLNPAPPSLFIRMTCCLVSSQVRSSLPGHSLLIIVKTVPMYAMKQIERATSRGPCDGGGSAHTSIFASQRALNSSCAEADPTGQRALNRSLPSRNKVQPVAPNSALLMDDEASPITVARSLV